MNKFTYLKKIFDILDAKQRSLFFMLSFLFILLALIEVLSIGIILPVIYVLIDQSSEVYKYIFSIYSYFIENLSHQNLIIISLLIVILIYLIKAVLYAFITWLSLKVTAKINIELTNKLYKSYLNESFLFHLSQNSSKLLRNVLSEVSHFCNLIYLLIQMLSDILMIIFITIMLLIVEPIIITVLLMVLFCISSTYYIFIAKKIYLLGKVRQESDFYIVKYVNESFSLIKEIIIYNLQNFFLSKHKEFFSKSTFADVRHNFLSTMTRPLLETVTLIIFVILIVYIVVINRTVEFQNYIPFIAFLGASTFKLLPVINSLTSKLGHIKFVLPSIDAVYDNLKLFDIENTVNSLRIIEEIYSKAGKEY